MDDNNLDRLITGIKAVELPECPSSLRADVLREVRMQDDASGSLLDVLLHYKAAFALVGCFALSMSIWITSSTMKSYQHTTRPQQVAHALDFNTFSASSSSVDFHYQK